MATKRSSVKSGNSGHAPDLELLGDTITLQPRGFEQDVQEDGDKDRNLVEHMARFRTSPLEYVFPPPSLSAAERASAIGYSAIMTADLEIVALDS